MQTSQTAARRVVLHEEVLHWLAIRNSRVEISFDQVNRLVDGRMARIEEMHQA